MSNVIQLKRGSEKPPNNTLASGELGLGIYSSSSPYFYQLYAGAPEALKGNVWEIGVGRLANDEGALSVGSAEQPVYFSNGIPVAGYSSYISEMAVDATGAWVSCGPLSITYASSGDTSSTNTVISFPPGQQHGIILNMTNSPWRKTLNGTTYSGSDVCQFWFGTLSANLYKRGGNYQGWKTNNNKNGENNSNWVLMLDENNFSSYCLPNATVPIGKGGTGATDQATARSNLGLGTVAIESIVPISKGGTGAKTAEAALSNLGAAEASHTHNYLPLSGGTLTGDLKINPGVNIVGTATKNDQEWSFDMCRDSTSYTGCKFHIWSARLGDSVLECFADNGLIRITQGRFSMGDSSGNTRGWGTGDPDTTGRVKGEIYFKVVS